MSTPLVELGSPARAGLRDRVLLLRSSTIMQDLDDDGLTLLAEHGKTRLFRAGETITEQGEEPRALHVIVDGRITVSIHGAVTSTLQRGDAYGMLPMLASSSTARAVADVETRTLEIPTAACLAAIEQNFSMLRGSLRVLGGMMARSRGNLPGDPDKPPVVDVGTYYERPRTLVERIIELRSGPFASLDVDAIVTLARSTAEHRLPAGHVLWTAGEPAAHAAHIKYGRIRCTSPDGRHMDVGSEFTLGVMDGWGTQTRCYTARAETPVIYYRVGFDDFLGVIEGHAHVGFDTLKGFARELLANREKRVTAGASPAW